MQKWVLVGSIMILAAMLVDAREIPAGCSAAETDEDGSWFKAQAAIMGTEVRVEVWHGNGEYACAAIAAALDEVRRVDDLMSPYKKSSMLSRMNADAATKPVAIGAELFQLLEESKTFSRLTDGAFDVTFASAGRYYDYREGTRPDADTLKAAVPAIDYRHLALDPDGYLVRYLHDGVYVDLGGIGKGYAVDRAVAVLEARGISQAMVGAGGDSRIIGDRRGEPWVVGVRDPRQEGEMVAVLPLLDIAVSTSGDYERFFEADGVRYHHIIDPETGDSARAVRSVTILGARATTTDALSTSVFVLGVEGGLALVNRLDDIDAIIVDGNGEVHVSAGLMDLAAAH